MDTPMDTLPDYRYRGARALVLLHDRHLRAFLDSWRSARAAGVALPDTSDPNYASLDTLLTHVLRAARSYMTWMCERLDLPDPAIDEAPEPAEAEARAEAYLEHLLARWREPLADLERARFRETHTTRWGDDLPIEAMLEHAVMHPIRHAFQLEELRAAQQSGR